MSFCVANRKMGNKRVDKQDVRLIDTLDATVFEKNM